MKNWMTVLLLICTSGFANLGFADDLYKLDGAVMTESYQPLKGALVTLVNTTLQQTITVITDEEGRWRVPTLVSGGNYNYTAELKGYSVEPYVNIVNVDTTVFLWATKD